MKNRNIKIGFFGTPEYAVTTINKLHNAGFNLAFVVTGEDKHKGRNMLLTSSPVKQWAISHGVEVLQNIDLKDSIFEQTLRKYSCDVFIVIGYGKIIPESILNIPKAKSLNIHGSLLPRLRGPSPIEGAILNDERNTGVSIIRMDKDMDHGPIIAQENISIDNWPPYAEELREKIVTKGTDLLVSILPDWINGKIKEKEQDHDRASYTKIIKKEDGQIDLEHDAYKNFLKIKAYRGWPSVFFFKHGKRIKITEAHYEDGKLVIKKIIPEGKKEIFYKDWLAI